MYDPKEIISDEDLIEPFQNTNFGSLSNREVIDGALLKAACDFYNGHTSETIIQELGLISPKTRKLTAKGKEYLYRSFRKNNV